MIASPLRGLFNGAPSGCLSKVPPTGPVAYLTGDCGLFAEDASDLAFDFFDDAFLYTVAVEVADETGTLDLFDNLGH